MNFYTFVSFTHKTKWQIYLISSPFSQGYELTYRPIISKLVQCPLVYSSAQKAQNHGLWCCIYLYAHTPNGEEKMSLHTNVAVHLRRRNSLENAVPDLNETIDVLKDLAKTQWDWRIYVPLFTPFSNSHASGLQPKVLETGNFFFMLEKKLRGRSTCTLFHLTVNIGIMRTVTIYCTALGFKTHVLTSENISQILKSTRQNEN